MTISDARLDELEQIAKEATPGPWEEVGKSVEQLNWEDGKGDIVSREVDCGSYCLGGTGEGVVRVEDSAHIAAFDPPTALALIADVRRLRVDANVNGQLRDVARAERDALQAKLDKVRRLHERTWEQQLPTATLCWGCDEPVPCSTIEALGGDAG